MCRELQISLQLEDVGVGPGASFVVGIFSVYGDAKLTHGMQSCSNSFQFMAGLSVGGSKVIP